MGNRSALVQYMKDHQKEHSCESLILNLETSSNQAKGWSIQLTMSFIPQYIWGIKMSLLLIQQAILFIIFPVPDLHEQIIQKSESEPLQPSPASINAYGNVIIQVGLID